MVWAFTFFAPLDGPLEPIPYLASCLTMQCCKSFGMSVDVVRDSETIARINGVASQMSKFSFLVGVVLGE